MTLPFAMGAVVEGLPTTFQTPLAGQTCPVRAVVPMLFIATPCRSSSAAVFDGFSTFDQGAVILADGRV